MDSRGRQDARSVYIKRRHGACQPARYWKESIGYFLKSVALIGLRGHGRGEKQRRQGLYLGAADV